MDVQETISKAREAITVKRVYGEPYEKDGATVIPAASVRGGAGGGSGESPDGSGGGTGFGITARPVGAYVIRSGEVNWQPAFDLNRAIFGAQIMGVIMFLALRSIARARAKARVVEARTSG
jgi:uncharacterized spore protein YtfJ